MVSFQCEACGDVLTKKKLDPHRGQCRGATYSCLDCMVHFQGTQYKSHTSCMTEDQKYQGALYKEKPSKQQKRKKTVSIAVDDDKSQASSLVPRGAYVEDAPDADDYRSKTAVPPPAPSPPPATPVLTAGPTSNAVAKTEKNVDVFDFLETGDQSKNASKVSLGGTQSQMKMVAHAPSVFDQPKELSRLENGNNNDTDDANYDLAYEEHGFSYGAGPIPPALYNQPSNVSMEFMTPAARSERNRPRRDNVPSLEHSRTSSLIGGSEKKRKRGQRSEVVTPAPISTRFEDDVSMNDAPSSVIAHPSSTPMLNHSGLTGGLNRMMRYSESPDYSDYRSDEDYPRNAEYHDHPVSPIKRSRRGEKDANGENGLGISIKGRAGKFMSLLGSGANTTVSADPAAKALVRTRRRSSSDADKDSRKQKRNKVRQPETQKSRRRTSALPNDDDPRHRRLKAIEYHPRDSKHKDADDNQLVIYRNGKNDSEDLDSLHRETSSLFLSLITKGPDSERGCSIHKILKRFHRDMESPGNSEERDHRDHRDSEERARGRGRRRVRPADRDRRDEEEQALWRNLRLKRNDRGEVVVFLQDA